jgi:hypothetical protein
MPQLDFKEIPQGNLANGEQDTFELFAREFLEMTGYEILSGPDRGSDGGRDIIVQEIRTGIAGTTHVKWLVSCKHKAHSGSSVGLTDEQDITDRVRLHDCAGFIGFYSTLPASSLTKKLEGFVTTVPGFEFQIIDKEKIERVLLGTGPGLGIAHRFFPISYGKWDSSNRDVDLAMLRIGMPQPVAYKISGDDKVYTLEEIMEKYPQGNHYIFNPWLPLKLILSNHILGITKIMGKDGLEDIPPDYLEQMTRSMEVNIEHMRQQRIAEQEKDKAADKKRRAKQRTKTKNKSRK